MNKISFDFTCPNCKKADVEDAKTLDGYHFYQCPECDSTYSPGALALGKKDPIYAV